MYGYCTVFIFKIFMDLPKHYCLISTGTIIKLKLHTPNIATSMHQLMQINANQNFDETKYRKSFKIFHLAKAHRTSNINCSIGHLRFI